MIEVKKESHAIGEFLDWLQVSRGITLAEYGDNELHPASLSPEKLLAEYFGIDLDAAKKERQAILRQYRKEATNDKL